MLTAARCMARLAARLRKTPYSQKWNALKVTLNSIGDAVLSTDISGNVTYLNLAAEKMTGWSREEAVGRPLAEVFCVVGDETRETAANPMELAVRHNQTVSLPKNSILIRRMGSNRLSRILPLRFTIGVEGSPARSSFSMMS